MHKRNVTILLEISTLFGIKKIENPLILGRKFAIIRLELNDNS